MSKGKTDTITTDQQRAEATKLEKLRENEETRRMQSVMGTKDGRDLLSAMLDDCGCGVLPPKAYVCDRDGRLQADAVASHVRLQDMGREWMEAMVIAAPQQFRAMRAEAIDATVREYEQRLLAK